MKYDFVIVQTDWWRLWCTKRILKSKVTWYTPLILRYCDILTPSYMPLMEISPPSTSIVIARTSVTQLWMTGLSHVTFVLTHWPLMTHSVSYSLVNIGCWKNLICPEGRVQSNPTHIGWDYGSLHQSITHLNDVLPTVICSYLEADSDDVFIVSVVTMYWEIKCINTTLYL